MRRYSEVKTDDVVAGLLTSLYQKERLGRETRLKVGTRGRSSQLR